jgi:hypothetical protein
MQDGSPTPADAPSSPWDLLAEFSKTIVSLSSGLLAVTVTFSTSFLKGNNSGLAVIFLAFAWLFLIASTILALMAAAGVINFLRGKDKEQRSILYNNCAFFALAAAGALFVAAGISQTSHGEKPTAGEIAKSALSLVPSLAGDVSNDWVVKSLTWNNKRQTYDLTLRHESLGIEYSMFIEADRGRVVEARRSSVQRPPSPRRPP